MDELAFKSKLMLNNLNLTKLAGLLGIDKSTLSHKYMNKHKEQFTYNELCKMKEILKLDDAEFISIFFKNKVS